MATAATTAATPAKCTHKGCGKTFTDLEEECRYHPGGPVFHEGQKGWQCCKPRVLTFDEFLAIPPCTVGKHSTVDTTPDPDVAKREQQAAENAAAAVLEQNKAAAAAATTTNGNATTATTAAVTAAAPAPAIPAKKDETEDDDDPSLPIPENATCRRRGCKTQFSNTLPRDATAEKCTYHPGQPIFHEGSKGWSCCKRRVLEFDQFLKIEGCKERQGHQFVGRKKSAEEEELLDDVRSDFYQTETTLTFSLYLKNIKKDEAVVSFPDETSMAVDLPTADNKRFKQVMPLFGAVDPARCKWKVIKTKFEGVLVKKEAGGWSTLRRDERGTGERIQVGKARRV